MEYLNPKKNKAIEEYVKRKLRLEKGEPEKPKYKPREDNSWGLNMLGHKGIGYKIDEDNYE